MPFAVIQGILFLLNSFLLVTGGLTKLWVSVFYSGCIDLCCFEMHYDLLRMADLLEERKVP